ncbi:MAG: DUF502 domain-containing protein [Alphaproteobacteria bacterium]
MKPTDPEEKDAAAGNDADDDSYHTSILARLRRHFLAGLLVAAPIGITLLLTWQFLGFVDRRVTPFIPEVYNPNTYLPFGVPGVGLIFAIIVLTGIGALTTMFIGRSLLGISERLLHRMPVIRGIYGALKQIFQTILAHKSEAFRQVVLLEYPRRGIWALGFVTGVTEGEVQNATSDDVVNVFLPTTPNPTSGFLLFLPKRDLIYLAMTVEEGAKMIISGGIVTPPDTRPLEQQKVKLVARSDGDTPTIKDSDAPSLENLKRRDPA